jgi:translocation and assembly module TamA
VHIALTPAPRKQVTYGVGYSTDTGPTLRFGRNNRRWNERGHQFGLSAQLSPVTSEVIASYRLPYGDPRQEWIHFDAGIQSEDTESSKSDSVALGVRRLSRGRLDWIRTDMLALEIEDFDVADQSGRSRLLMPGVNWNRTRADNRVRIKRGSLLQLDVRGAGDALGSDTTFLQTVATARWIWPFANSGRALVRGQLGATAFEDFDELPASVRFFAGGDNSVRGYGFEELGPVDDEGEVIGGSSLLTASFEYEHPLRERWGIAFFVDTGNAFEGSDLSLKTGVGLGGRWQSPVGPVRLDLAYPLDDPTNDWRVHITLGPDL